MALNLKKTFSAGVAGIVAGAALSMSAAFAEPAANTNAPQAQTTAVTAEQARAAQPTVQPAFQVASNGMPSIGAPVVFEYGDGINPETVASVVRVVSAQGCPASAIKGIVPDTVMVDTNGVGEMFSDAGAAGSWALDNCKSPSVALN